MALIRVTKFISQCGAASRRKAEELLVSGKVKINGRIVKELGTKIDPEKDRIQVRNKFIQAAHKGVLLLHKPRGVVSTLSDPEGRPSIKDFLTYQYRSYFPVGRLDFDSSGLLVLTNDGELAERLMHPRFGFKRVYEAKVGGSVVNKTITRLGKGIMLDDGVARASISIVETADNYTWLRVEVSEGRNRLVRRLLEKVGHPVNKLQRISHGPVFLGKLGPGEVKKLTEKEYDGLKRKVFGKELPKSKHTRKAGWAKPRNHR